MSHLFGTWLNNQPKNLKGLIWVGVAALGYPAMLE
jgi:hypothetical protein